MAAQGHALLSPSSSHRWINCTPSARLEEHVEDKGSSFAEQGSCAHALCEIKLRALMRDDSGAGKEEFEALKDKWYDKEMEACAEDYATEVWSKYMEAAKKCKHAKIFVEKRLDFTPWIPNSFGTSDAMILTDDTMEVIDFKYGKGVEVSAVKNPQMAIYALGAVADYELDYDILNVKMTIIQPRIHNISEWETSLTELKTWANTTLVESAKLAYEGKGKQKAGEWCRFCKVKARCAVLANDALAAYTQHDDKTLIGAEEMPYILSLIPAIKSWCTAVEDYATAKAVEGTIWPGYKLVEGRSVRKVTDSEKLAEALFYALSDSDDAKPEDIYKPIELKSITELERMVGKKRFADLSQGFIEKPAGKPTLVPESDKRQPISIDPVRSDFAEFEINNNQ